ncbi:MAG: hypothetical protein KDA60_11990 [Planctomycetales bacterium]|nr:hypothetical protein [Planctomycetales bacterium]
MNLRTQKLLLAFLAFGMVLASMLLLYWGAIEPFSVATSRDLRSTRTQAHDRAPYIPPTLDDFGPALELKLQRPLYDPPPPEPPPPPPKRRIPPPRVTLLGTMLERGAEQAILRMPDGSTSFKSIGDTIPGESNTSAVITEIKERHIMLRHEDELVTIPLESR